MSELKDYKALLSDFIKLKSISTDPSFKGEIEKTSEWLKTLFRKSGFEVEILKGKTCNPVVLASYSVSSEAETVLIYGHYDVQPPGSEEDWLNNPFELTEKNGRLYARGSVDNKGQIAIHIFTVLKLIEEKRLKRNVKFLIEGNEETANPELPKLIRENKKKLKCDHILISDGELPGGRPAIEYSLRGGFNLTLTYTTADNNVHSGIFGGAVPNAAYELSKFLSTLYDKNNRVAISGFYEDVDAITPEQKKNNEKVVGNVKKVLKMIGAKALKTEPGLDFLTQTGLRPTVQITGLKSGYISEGYSNIVPCTAEVRLNFRTVSSQDEKKVLRLFKEHVKKFTPEYVKYSISVSSPYGSVKIDTSSSKVAKVRVLLKEAFGEEVLIKPVGGGIPVVLDFKNELGVDSLLVSLGNDDCNMHGVNENFDIILLEKGLKFSELFFGGSDD